ncbi:MAG: hypothetical protein IJK04_05880 [Kiritimatiellae bacterium]|nr:hypothetical protein [Kiritimatiellia bacterium]
MRSFKEKRGRYCVRVINVSISTVKAAKIIRRANGLAGDERDAYLLGVRDVIGGDLGCLFSKGVASGDIRNVARFCHNGWRVMGGDAAATAFFSAKMDVREFLREMRRLCDKAIREGGAQ